MIKQKAAVLFFIVSRLYVSQAFQFPTSSLRPLANVQRQTRLQQTVLRRECRLEGACSPLFAAPGESESNKRKNPFDVFRKIVNKFSVSLSRASARFSSLSRRAKSIVCFQLIVIILLLGGLARNSNTRKATTPVELPFSQFMDIIETQSSRAVSVSAKGDDLHILDLKIGTDTLGFQIARGNTPEQLKALREYREGKNPSIPIPTRLAYTRKVSASPELIDYLRRNQIPFRAASMSNATVLGMAARGLFLMFYLLFMLRMMKTMTGGGGGSGPGKLANLSELPLASFSDVQGIDSAKFEVMELVDTLRNPDKYAIMGARAPKGLLLEGPPGTGKTLLARATAATAGVPLLYCSGSDFVEMFVGRGAARVRKTFERAKKLAPCLIFIDELDALGKSRETGMMANMRGNDEAEQTLNQLLACMDGLDSKGSQICVMAATNRREVLDTALLRPGRFDRIVRLELPDSQGREAILRVHARKLPGFKECSGLDGKSGMFGKGDAVDLSAVAFATSGFSGAELESIVNEAAIRAVRRVSTALRDPNVDPNTITPNVRAEDFEGAIATFFASRSKRSNGGMGDILNNVWKG